MADPAAKRATYEDVLSAPEHMIAEVIDGVLWTQPHPATAHVRVVTNLNVEIGRPFNRAIGGPGGWVILLGMELHLGVEPDILVPDLAGWRRETMPEMPEAPFFTLRPTGCSRRTPRPRR